MDENSCDYVSPADRTSDMIGDGSQPYALPTLKIKNDRFKRIDAATLVKLIEGHFKDMIESFTIIDCRYPYEYQGGHIINSLNIHNAQELTKYFIDERPSPVQNNNTISFNNNNSSLSSTSSSSLSSDNQQVSVHENPSNSAPENFCTNLRQHLVNETNNTTRNSRHILIFHCEYSSERGPKLMKFLREKDRQINKYPELLHPELYLLEGGYREFYKKFKEFCVPQAYKPMNCRNHKDDLRRFRKRKKLSLNPRRKENKVPDISFEA